MKLDLGTLISMGSSLMMILIVNIGVMTHTAGGVRNELRNIRELLERQLVGNQGADRHRASAD